MTDSPAFSDITPEAIINCETCGKKIWKYWHVGFKKVFPEMTQCAPCLFETELNPIEVRHLSSLEIAQSKVLLEQLKEDMDTSKKTAKGNLNNG